MATNKLEVKRGLMSSAIQAYLVGKKVTVQTGGGLPITGSLRRVVNLSRTWAVDYGDQGSVFMFGIEDIRQVFSDSRTIILYERG